MPNRFVAGDRKKIGGRRYDLVDSNRFQATYPSFAITLEIIEEFPLIEVGARMLCAFLT